MSSPPTVKTHSGVVVVGASSQGIPRSEVSNLNIPNPSHPWHPVLVVVVLVVVALGQGL